MCVCAFGYMKSVYVFVVVIMIVLILFSIRSGKICCRCLFTRTIYGLMRFGRPKVKNERRKNKEGKKEGNEKERHEGKGRVAFSRGRDVKGEQSAFPFLSFAHKLQVLQTCSMLFVDDNLFFLSFCSLSMANMREPLKVLLSLSGNLSISPSPPLWSTRAEKESQNHVPVGNRGEE